MKFEIIKLLKYFLAFTLLFFTIKNSEIYSLNNKTDDLPISIKNNKENALVFVYRNDENFGYHISFYVYINDPDNNQMLAGFTKGHQYIYFYLKPGKYTIFSKADNIDKININVNAGETYFIKQIPLPGIKATNEIKLVELDEARGTINKYEIGNINRKTFL